MMLLSPLDGVWRVNNKSSLTWWMWEVTGPFCLLTVAGAKATFHSLTGKVSEGGWNRIGSNPSFRTSDRWGGDQSIQHKWRCSIRAASPEQSKTPNIKKATQNIDQKKHRPANLKFKSTSKTPETFSRIQKIAIVSKILISYVQEAMRAELLSYHWSWK